MKRMVNSDYVKRLLVLIIAFTVAACTRDPAPPIERPVIVELDVRDSNYMTINGRKQVLLGFDLLEDSTAAKRPKIVEEVARHGGNLLKLDSSIYDGVEWQRLRFVAGEEGVVIDAGDLPIEARQCSLVKEFNRLLLTGEAAVTFTNFNQRNLNAIRAVRTVEYRLKMADLKPNGSLLQQPAGGAIGADDGQQNYVVYTPTLGTIDITLDEGQFARTVTVVGHLGTQRSETLYPPYDRSFTILSNDEQGGWLIIKRAEE